MITKIGFELGKNYNKSFKNKQKNSEYMSQSFSGNLGNNYNLNYFVPFTSRSDKNVGQSKFEIIYFNTDTPTKNLLNILQKEATNTGYDKITTLHVLRHGLDETLQYVDDLNTGKKEYTIDTHPPMVDILGEAVTYAMFSEPLGRKALTPILQKQIKILDNLLAERRPEKTSGKNNKDKVAMSQDLLDSMWAARVNSDDPVDLESLYGGAYTSPDEITDKFATDFELSLYNVYFINNMPMKDRAPFSEHEKKAKNVLKNIFLGTNMFVTYEPKKEDPSNFIDTVKKVFNEGDYKDFTYTEFNALTKPEFFAYKLNKLAADKTKKHIVVLNPSSLILQGNLGMEGGGYGVPQELTMALQNPPANVRFLLYDAKDNYYSVISNPAAAVMYSSFEETNIPVLSTSQMVKSFKENPSLMKDISKPFTKKAMDKAVEASLQLDGVFPEKTQKLMKKIVSYYIDKKEITDKDVANYVKEATSIFKKDADNNNSIDIVFDTGKKLDGMVGKSSTQKEAAAIVKQIKANKLGTKGIVLYSEDGSPGSGRRYTAKAIAGEAKVPYAETNAVDFGTKDVDLFGGGLTPEAAIKKLFGVVKTQAEANSNKSAVLFIENFEYFSVGELVSLYHQKAMAQLLREMERADKEGLNILVAGSVSNPDLIGEATMKSFKFVDSVEVSSPAYDDNQRAQVIKRAMKDLKIKTTGSEEEQQAIIDYAASITQGFAFIQLKNFVKKAQSVAQERGHKAILKGDMTEAYLQIVTGRPSLSKIEEHEKRIVSSHECGHAVNLEVMNNVAKTLGKPWHIPTKVNFITLDPRGNYGGAVFEGKDVNNEIPFEYMFANIVCAFGGNSAESHFYNIDGSYGISSDMRSVRHDAEIMVKVMGLGAKTGKMVIGIGENPSDKMKTMIEDDERVIINNAKLTSDMITEVYADFNSWFTEKYAPLVGTGDCILDGDKFREALKKWKSEQSPEKQEELALCDSTIKRIMEATKNGIAIRKES